MRVQIQAPGTPGTGTTMALVDSLLTAMVRANGDALVMHVGERPYVVRESGTLDLSAHGLNLDAMTGMLAQLLPEDAQSSLQEFGAVEHRLPDRDGERFTVVAARGGDDIWIEIRRRRPKPEAPAAPPAPEPIVEAPTPVVEAPPVVSLPPEPPPLIAAPALVAIEPAVPIMASTANAAIEDLDHILATPIPDEEDFVVPTPVEDPQPAEAPPPVEEPYVIDEPAAIDEPEYVEDPAPAPVEDPDVVELVASDEPIVIDDVPIVIEQPVFASASAAPQPVEPVEPPEPVEPVAPVEPVEPARVVPMTRTVRIEVPPRMPAAHGFGVERLLRIASSRGASALFLTTGSRPYVRLEGDIRVLDTEAVLSRADIEAAALEIGSEDAGETLRKGEHSEWIAELPEVGRIRCTSFNDHNGPGVLFRMIATRAATAEQLGLSREVQNLATEAEGLVLVGGSRGSGKSTLMSALVDLVNRQRAEYVISLERQIRLVHENRQALVSQREIRGGADEALAAARAALRENPDVLVVDDLGSPQMVPLLLEAAAQGLLVFASITAHSTTDAVEKFVDLAPPEIRKGVQTALGETFRGAVSQTLFKKTGGGRAASREILLGTASVTRLIADGQLGQLPLALESGRKHGMVPLTDELLSLVKSGVVDAREAFRKTHDRDRLIAGLKREGIDTAAVERLA